MSPCIGEPISYLRLERYALHELPAPEEQVVRAHLARCEACRACFAQTQQACELPALPELSPARVAQPARRTQASALAQLGERVRGWLAPARVRAGLSLAGALAAAAAAWLALRPHVGPGLEPPRLRAARLGVKGGELAIELVRKHGAALAEPSRFAPGDAFKVLLTCPPPGAPHVDVVVYQAGAAYFPLEATTLAHCGNRIALPGAFSLDGAQPAAVCAIVSDTPVARAALARGPAALTEMSVCITVIPVN